MYNYEAIYEVAKSNGCSDRLADLLASRQAPALRTDTYHFKRLHANPLEQVRPALRPKYAALAKKAGVSISGKKYMGSLARFPGDPQAWVDSRGDAKKLIEQRGWGADGLVKVKPKEAPPLPDKPPPAEDIVVERAMNIAARDGVKDKCSVKEWNGYKEKATASLT